MDEKLLKYYCLYDSVTDVLSRLHKSTKRVNAFNKQIIDSDDSNALLCGAVARLCISNIVPCADKLRRLISKVISAYSNSLFLRPDDQKNLHYTVDNFNSFSKQASTLLDIVESYLENKQDDLSDYFKNNANVITRLTSIPIKATACEKDIHSLIHSIAYSFHTPKEINDGSYISNEPVPRVIKIVKLQPGSFSVSEDVSGNEVNSCIDEKLTALAIVGCKKIEHQEYKRKITASRQLPENVAWTRQLSNKSFSEHDKELLFNTEDYDVLFNVFAKDIEQDTSLCRKIISDKRDNHNFYYYVMGNDAICGDWEQYFTDHCKVLYSKRKKQLLSLIPEDIQKDINVHDHWWLCNSFINEDGKKLAFITESYHPETFFNNAPECDSKLFEVYVTDGNYAYTKLNNQVVCFSLRNAQITEIPLQQEHVKFDKRLNIPQPPGYEDIEQIEEQSISDKLKFAAQNKLLVELSYYSPDDKKYQHVTVEPYSFRKQNVEGEGYKFYLLGHERNSQDNIKSFRLDYIQQVDVLNKRFEPEWEIEIGEE